MKTQCWVVTAIETGDNAGVDLVEHLGVEE